MPTEGQRVGEYVLQDRIATGTFGEVWRANHHVWIDQLVAVKIPTDPQYLRNLQSEGVAVHGLQHVNIVRAIGFDPYADPAYLAMEYVPGTNLRQLIQNKSLKLDDVVAVMRQILAGLGHAHKQNLVHRDMKPENILVHERAFAEGFNVEGVVKVTDFGLGKVATNTAGSIAYSQASDTPVAREIAGTLDYMAPEQRFGSEVDPRADLYSCGVVLYEMLTGERPAGMDLPSDMNRAVPKHLDDAFRRSYARLDKRLRSAEEFITALLPETPSAPAAAGSGAPRHSAKRVPDGHRSPPDSSQAAGQASVDSSPHVERPHASGTRLKAAGVRTSSQDRPSQYSAGAPLASKTFSPSMLAEVGLAVTAIGGGVFVYNSPVYATLTVVGIGFIGFVFEKRLIRTRLALAA